MDMRASPYDLSDWGYEAIKIETHDGRREYEELQKLFAKRAAHLRGKLITSIDHIIGSPSLMRNED